MAIRKLRNLLLATEAVRYDQRVRVSLARFGRQHVLATLDRDLVFFLLKPNDLAMPQHPESGDSGSTRVFSSHFISASMLRADV